MKLGKIAAAAGALQKLAGEALTPRTLYRVSRLVSRAEKELEFYNTARDKIVKTYGEHVKDAEYRIPGEKRAEFEVKMRELDEIEIEGEIQTVRIPLDENIRLSCNDLRLLEGLVELEDEENEGSVNHGA